MNLQKFEVMVKDEDTQRVEEVILIMELENPSVEFLDGITECIKKEYTKQCGHWARGIEVRWLY